MKEHKLTNKEIAEFVKQLALKQDLSISNYLHLLLYPPVEETIKEYKDIMKFRSDK